MHHPTYFLALQSFALVDSAPPRVYYGGQAVALRWARAEVETGDLLKYAPTGTLSVFRQGSRVAQQTVTTLAVRSFVIRHSSTRGGFSQPKSVVDHWDFRRCFDRRVRPVCCCLRFVQVRASA